MPKADKKEVLWCLDFDHTLFDTDRFFYVDLLSKLLYLGIEKKFHETYEGVRKTGYSFEKHLKEIGRGVGSPQLVSRVRKALDNSFNDLRRYLFSDAIPFIERIKSDPRAKLFLVSRGDSGWQLHKINKSGLGKYFDKIFIVERENVKSGVLKKYINRFDEINFVDNNPLELDEIKKKYPSVLTFLIDHVPPASKLKKLPEAGFLEAKKYSKIIPKQKHMRHSSLRDILKNK